LKGSVLLVEDDTRIRSIYAYLLVQAGYTVIEAASVATALMHLNALDLSCIVLDLKLPNGHGRRVVEELQSKRDDVPVVVLSGHYSDGDWDFPVVAVLQKPPAPVALVEAVEKASSQADAIREIRNSTRRLRGITGVL